MIQSMHCWAAPAVPQNRRASERRPYSSDHNKLGGRLKKRDLTSAGSWSLREQVKMKMRYPRATLVVENEPREDKNADPSSNGSLKRGYSDGKVQSVMDSGHTQVGHGAAEFWDNLSEIFDEEEGPPRWICPVSKSQQTVSNAPLLLFLPGIIGTSVGLSFHYKGLGRLFELRSLHVPIMDRTPFEGLVSIVEEAVHKEAALTHGNPVYLVGDEFGGALALAVAARNPKLDLALVLLNPATSIDTSALQPLLTVLRALPAQMFNAAPVLLGFLASDPLQFSSNRVASTLPRFESLQNVSEILGNVILSIPKIVRSLSKETVLWKLDLLIAGVKHANSQLNDVKADVLILASNKDQFLPSLQEAKRLSKILPHCTYRQFTASRHSLLLEEAFDLASVIKSTGHYRQTNRKDAIADFVFPSEEEINKFYDSNSGWRRFCSPVFFSTGDDGQVTRGLSMIPSKRPLLFVGNHALLGLDMKVVFSEFLKTRQEIPRGLAHPMLFMNEYLEENPGIVEGDLGRLYGAVPVSAKNMYKLLAKGDHVALYPGGAREALHRKGEQHMLFWPEQAEFIKMAAKFGATIIPLSTVGVDDMLEILADFDDLSRIPILGDQIVEFYKRMPQIRTEFTGEVSKQVLHMPVVWPKLQGPGRMYILFGQPIYTEGKQDYFKNQENVMASYHHVKGQVEAGLSYLVKKRQSDPYRKFLPRMIYETLSAPGAQAPTFEI